MKKIQRLVRICIYFIKLTLAAFFSFIIKLFYKEKRNIWIISERGDDARDNGYFFFKYLVEKCPKQKVYFIIDPKSPDFKKIEAIGSWIKHNSFKHFLYFELCKVRISSSVWGGDIPVADYYKKTGFWKKEKRKVVFLQHGITKDYMPLLEARNVKIDLFVCGAKPEYDYIKNSFGHNEGIVQYTGFARYDNLNDIETKKQILIMPTFRKWLQKISYEEVKESEYIKAWNDVLNDKKLISLLKNNNLQLIFYPHYVMQKYIDLFKTNAEEVIIAKFKDYDVQKLLIESKLLVTDFSSVFFDFAYMNKPVIYYQFDRKKYINEHYNFTKGYFDYDEMGMGPVVLTKEKLIESITKSIELDFKVPNVYVERANKFFEHRDCDNSKRIYEKIKALQEVQK